MVGPTCVRRGTYDSNLKTEAQFVATCTGTANSPGFTLKNRARIQRYTYEIRLILVYGVEVFSDGVCTPKTGRHGVKVWGLRSGSIRSRLHPLDFTCSGASRGPDAVAVERIQLRKFRNLRECCTAHGSVYGSVSGSLENIFQTNPMSESDLQLCHAVEPVGHVQRPEQGTYLMSR